METFWRPPPNYELLLWQKLWKQKLSYYKIIGYRKCSLTYNQMGKIQPKLKIVE
jgi:hypothetical protein